MRGGAETEVAGVCDRLIRREEGYTYLKMSLMFCLYGGSLREANPILSAPLTLGHDDHTERLMSLS